VVKPGPELFVVRKLQIYLKSLTIHSRGSQTLTGLTFLANISIPLSPGIQAVYILYIFATKSREEEYTV